VPRICIVGPSAKYFGGISAYTIRLANALSVSNNVSVLLLRNLLPRFLYPGKYNVGRQDYTIHFRPQIKIFEGMDWNSPESWFRAYRFLKKEKPDVIIMQWWTSSVAHLELLLALANRVKIKRQLIVEMHEIIDPLEAGNPIIHPFSRMTGNLIMRRTDAFVVHSAPVREQAIQTYHLRGDRVFVIPHGVYDNYFQEQNQGTARKELGIDEKFVVLNFGMIRKYKGIPRLVEAFNRLPAAIAENSRLIIAGEDWGDEPDLETAIRSSPFTKQITFEPRFVPEPAVSRYFSAADVVVLPYVRTSGSGVASLAMAYGKPIIVSSLECTRDSLQGYQGARFVSGGDASSISAKICEIYAQQVCGQAIFYPVPLLLTWQHITGEYEKVIQLISENSKMKLKS
jgi:glycosyltransferase involved in cell wall biosynthesis